MYTHNISTHYVPQHTYDVYNNYRILQCIFNHSHHIPSSPLTTPITTHATPPQHTRDCFIDTKDAVLYYFAIPVFVVICLNVVLFSTTVYSLRNTMKIAKQARPDGKRRSVQLVVKPNKESYVELEKNSTTSLRSI